MIMYVMRPPTRRDAHDQVIDVNAHFSASSLRTYGDSAESPYVVLVFD